MSRKEYFQEYYKKHREQFIEYYQLHREEILERQRSLPKEYQKEYQRQYYEKRKALRQATKPPKEKLKPIKVPKIPKERKPIKTTPKETLSITRGCFTLSFDF